MQKFILLTSGCYFLIFSFLISVNYWGDSAKIFHPGYENKIAEILFNNQNATNIANYDERILEKKLINKLKSSPDILVLGSSRTMLINSSYFDAKKVINNSVSGASLEDLIGIFQLYKAKNILPKKIILGIDPWLFNENSGQTRWHSLRKEYNSFINKESEINESTLSIKTKQLFSLSYFQASFRNLPNVIAGISDPIATDEINNNSNTKLVDASLSYGKTYREVSNEEVKIKARKYLSGKLYSIEKFKKISPQIFKEFKYFCQEILENNIELTFFIAPYHPLVYQKVEKDYQMVLETEFKVLEFAKGKNIECLGSFSSIKAGIDSHGFYDGMHSKENTIKKILKVRKHKDVFKSMGKW
jgi:hypothetical protein